VSVTTGCRKPRPSRESLGGLAAVLVLAIALLHTGCAGAPGYAGDAVAIDGLTFENRSASPVDGITLMVPATGGFVSCGRIAPGARCASGFPEVSYAGNPVEIRWNQGGAEWSTGLLTLNIDDEVRSRGRGEVRVVVIAPGSAGVLLLPGSTVDRSR
jgi:hypothetical protein